RVREGEAVAADAEFLDEGAALVELEQPRLAAAGVDVDVALRVGGDADALAHVETGRQLEEVGNRVERNFWRRWFRLGRSRHGLGGQRRGGEQQAGDNADDDTLH